MRSPTACSSTCWRLYTLLYSASAAAAALRPSLAIISAEPPAQRCSAAAILHMQASLQAAAMAVHAMYRQAQLQTQRTSHTLQTPAIHTKARIPGGLHYVMHPQGAGIVLLDVLWPAVHITSSRYCLSVNFSVLRALHTISAHATLHMHRQSVVNQSTSQSVTKGGGG